MSKRKRFLFMVAAPVLALVVTDVLISLLLVRDHEILGHRLAPYASYVNDGQRQYLIQRREEIDREGERSGYRPYDAELGWVNLPAPKVEGARDGFNSIGARALREYTPRPADGHTRFVAFGESFTHCAQVGRPSSWEVQLEDLEPSWEVINMGVNGFGTDQALLCFRRHGPALAPHVVCIGLMLENIQRNVNRYLPILYPGATVAGKPRFVLRDERLEIVPLPFSTGREMLEAFERGTITRLLSEHEYWADPDLPAFAWHSSLVRIAASWRAKRARVWRSHWLDPEGEPYRVTLAILETFRREALAAGAEQAVVLLFTSYPDLSGLVERGDRYWSGLLSDLDRRGVRYIDLGSPLAMAWREAPRDAKRRLFSGAHLSHEGNAVVARAVRDWYRSTAAANPRPR